MNNGLPTNHIEIDNDGLVHGYDVTPFTLEEWHEMGQMFASNHLVEHYVQGIGLLFLQNSHEAVAALRAGWREGGGRDFAADFNAVPDFVEDAVVEEEEEGDSDGVTEEEG